MGHNRNTQICVELSLIKQSSMRAPVTFLVFLAGTVGVVLSDVLCDFEHGKCQSLTYDNYGWTVSQASNHGNLSQYAPQHDHTKPNTSTGHYLALQANPHIPKTSIQMSSLKLEKTSKCVEFWYVVYGDPTNSLNVSLLAGYDPVKCIEQKWFSGKPMVLNWTRGSFELPAENLTLEFQAAIPDGSKDGIIALDDIRIFDCNHTKPLPTPPARLPNCDFETDMCKFENGPYAELKWKRGKAKSASKALQRPQTDSTGNANGYYVYGESKNSSNPGDEARLTIPSFKVPADGAPYCVQFYFYSYLQTSKISVYNASSRTKDASVQINTVWSADTNSYLKWRWVIAPLSVGQAKLSIAQHVDDKKGSAGLAIDDVRILQCPILQEPPKQSKRYVNQMDCDFETTMCGISNVPEQMIKWVRVRASDVSKPKYDVNGQPDGHFMYLNTSSTHRTEGDLNVFGLLQSPELLVFNDWCIDLFYYVFDNSTNGRQRHANITIGLANDKGHTKTLFKSKHNMDGWQHARQIRLAAPRDCNLLFINGSVDNNVETHIAIDNLVIGSCTKIIPDITTAAPMTTESPTTTVHNVTDGTTAAMTTSGSANGTATWGPTTPSMTTSGDLTTTHSGVSQSGGTFGWMICMFLLLRAMSTLNN